MVSPSLRVSTFCAATIANVRWSAFLARRELLLGTAVCAALVRRRRSELGFTGTVIDLTSHCLNDEGLVGMTPLFEPHWLHPTMRVDVVGNNWWGDMCQWSV
jgi:hypothetical protein